jgi:hypothetical protein
MNATLACTILQVRGYISLQRERVAAKDEKNIEVRDDLATNYQLLGTVSAMLEKKSGNRQYAIEACHWYERGLEVMRDLEKRGALGKDDVEDMKNIAAEVSPCETAGKARGNAPQPTDFPAAH